MNESLEKIQVIEFIVKQIILAPAGGGKNIIKMCMWVII